MMEKKKLYAPPVVDCMHLQTEGFICQSGSTQLGNTSGFNDMGTNDLSTIDWIL